MASYSYDETGQYFFFLITFLTFLLVPWTIYTLKPKNAGSSKVKPPTEGWTVKHESVRRSRKRTSGLTKSHFLLAIGWVAFAFVLQRAWNYESAAIFYDPYSILGVSTGMTEKEIKRHYRKLSLKFHPDKLKLAENQTKEEADAHFVDLTKAYKALTDETVRENYEKYGHPDGKQEFSMGIALPSWIVESQNNGYVLGVYGLLFGVLMPIFVGRWWYSSKAYTKDGILTKTAEIYFRNLKEDIDFSTAVELLAASLEYSDENPKEKLVKYGPTGKANQGKAATDYTTLETDVRQAIESLLPAEKELLDDSALLKKPAAKRAAVYIYAHLLRVPIENIGLLRDKNAIVEKSATLCNAMMNIALAHSWLGSYLVVSSLQQQMIQGFHPNLSPLLQLPNVTVAQSQELAKAGARDFSTFIALDEKQRKEILCDLSDKEYSLALRVAQNFPTLEVVSAKFQVIGEKIVTAGSFVQLNLKIRITPPSSRPPPQLQVNGEGADQLAVEEGDEKDLDELLGRKKPGELGETPDAPVHAPLYPGARRPGWHVLVGDHKLYRIFVPPTRVSQIGYGKLRTLQVTFQAPPNVGLYTFQTYVKSDSYVGTDAQSDMMMEVKEPEAEGGANDPRAGGAAGDEDDDISEPEEDTIAGQMAAMRGQPYKRIEDGPGEEGEEEEDGEYTTSGSEDEEGESSDSSSDSDSD